MEESLISQFNLVKGDSSDVFLFSAKGIEKFDSDWSGSFVIVDETGAIKVQRDLPKTEESGIEPAGKYFVFQIYPEESALLNPGKHELAVEIKNLNMHFRRELVRTKIVVLKSLID